MGGLRGRRESGQGRYLGSGQGGGGAVGVEGKARGLRMVDMERCGCKIFAWSVGEVVWGLREDWGTNGEE